MTIRAVQIKEYYVSREKGCAKSLDLFRAFYFGVLFDAVSGRPYKRIWLRSPVDYCLLLLLTESPLFPASQSKESHTQFYNLCAMFLDLAGKTNLLYIRPTSTSIMSLLKSFTFALYPSNCFFV